MRQRAGQNAPNAAASSAARTVRGVRLYATVITVALLGSACGSSVGNTGGEDGSGSDANTSTSGDADVCLAPDMLIVLDRTGTMHRDLAGNTPADTADGVASAKLTIAIGALDALVSTPGLDATLRLGLELFPHDPGSCITLEQRLQNVEFTNAACEAADIAIPPDVGTGSEIAAMLDPATTTLCYSTPMGAALLSAQTELASIKKPGVDQYLLLVTDGADFDLSCPDPDPLPILRTLEQAGIKTFVVGFGAQDTTAQGVNPPVLNQMACAGGTAKDFTTTCVAASGGGYDAADPAGAHLYFDAANAGELSASLADIAGQICCGCVL